MMTTQRSGAITLLAVFFTASIAFLLLLGENVRAIDEKHRAHAEVISEQAFYASQSCLEEAFLQKRTSADYTGVANVKVGTATCTVTTTAGQAGSVTSTGLDQTIQRVIASAYHDAGASPTRQHTQIFHIIDRSGSMQEDSCSNTVYRNKSDCQHHDFVWGPILQPISDARLAAQGFNTDFMDPAYDQIGLVSYSSSAALNQGLTTSLPTINAAIGALAPGGTTDIGSAFDLATANLPAGSPAAQFEILLTDGVPNSDCGVDCTIAKAASAKARGITIFTIGLGTAVNRSLLETVASTNSTTGTPLYFPAPTHNDLSAIYAAIAHQIEEYRIGQSSWNEQ